VYDIQAASKFTNCSFDPVDDGSDESMWFPDVDPYSPLGPSSTCHPEFSFSCLGDTDEPFSPTRTGRATEGPGLAGSLGPGTWVESIFDLSPFRGRSVFLRFLFTSLKANDIPDYNALFYWSPTPADDGWYVDDVRITQTLGTTSPTVTLDESPPPLPASDADGDGIDDACDLCPGLANRDQRDRDRDGEGDPCDPDDDGDGMADAADCAPEDASAWTAPGPARNLKLEGRSPTVLRWEEPLYPGASEIWYDSVLTSDPADLSPATCSPASTSIHAERDLEPDPVSGAPRFYVVMAGNRCGRNAGAASSGAPRPVTACP
jgi:hypothetical protein